jgi:hypothetical protein
MKLMIQVILRALIALPTVIIWLLAWRVVMPEHAPFWRVCCGWTMVWLAADFYQWLKRKAA